MIIKVDTVTCHASGDRVAVTQRESERRTAPRIKHREDTLGQLGRWQREARSEIQNENRFRTSDMSV